MNSKFALAVIATVLLATPALAQAGASFHRMADGSCQLSIRHKVGVKLPPPVYNHVLIELALCKAQPDGPLQLASFRK